MRPYKLINKRFGNLLVKDKLKSGGKNKCQVWLCQCDCGKLVEKVTTELTRPKSKKVSCGRNCVLHAGKNSLLFTGHEDISGWLWCHIKKGAESRNLKFSITAKDGWDLYIKQNGKCALSGVHIWFPPVQKKRSEGTASLDRIDSNKGYEPSNCQWVHKDINFMKQDYSNEYFIATCSRVSNNNIVKQELNYNSVFMLPSSKCIVESRQECNTQIVLNNRTFEMPVYPANMKSVINEETCIYLANQNWFYTMHRFGIDPVTFTKKMHSKGLYSSISVGITPESFSQIVSLSQNESPEFITIDVANAWTDRTKHIIDLIKTKLPNSFVIVGNVAVPEAVCELEKWGADAIKVGIAGGSVCTTKNKTGFYRPMMSTLLECCNLTEVPIIADGGIREHGDIAKALTKASLVMAGSLFAGYDESAGDLIEIDGKQYKEYFGSASERNKKEKKNIEGKKILIPYKGGMDTLLKELKEDLQSSISYAGGKDLSALKKVKIVKI